MKHLQIATNENVRGPVPGRPRQEFHIRRHMREVLALDTALFSLSGTTVFADFAAVRRFAHDLERHRTGTGHADPAVRAGEIAAMGLLDEVMHHLLALVREERGENLLERALHDLSDRLGEETVESTLRRFCEEFPPAAVHRGELGVDEYLAERVEGLSGRERTLEEIVLLRLTNENPACARYSELFDESGLTQRTGSGYRSVFERIEAFYAAVPVGGGAAATSHVSVLDLLRAPARAHPNSLEEQLSFARDHWGAYIGKYLSRILRSLDVLREEDKIHADPGAGPPPAEVYRYDETEDQRFSQDTEWMPGVVMMAKSTLVWLYQLSERYGREITRLDQVPDEELDALSASGFNALWLIGVWERSNASRRIKHLSGNPDAEASAYALRSYEIADEVGGWPALEELRRKCSDRGIRLASDMVPNHTGIDSPWVHDHPEWYVHVDHPPFPSYAFTGENLSGRGDVGVYLEDHYFDRTDAAVVFKHVASDGHERYIYHGNDGTSMPWNDTAQLDYLNPEVREVVIQTILHVARNFPVIRFDAAMTLARRHVRRLWYPEPGAGGDIASRAEHGLSRDEFDRAMPQEFWREVVDRVAAEAPGTLLLAEAFWMMEGYFVRTLGMHRVYNSAFMNMLKSEQNAEYRELIRNTLAFDPEILKRFVNFMNNPDEETAVTQFGTGDKYFGVATLLATLPGLPMFGHGQIEGLAEKYGMEFRRPYWDEQPDRELIERHEREIFPLLRHRSLFASAASFRLFDLVTDGGGVNENCFVYTNQAGSERVLVAFNNSYERATGRARESAPFSAGTSARTEPLASALGLTGNSDSYLVWQEQRSGLWYLRRASAVHDEGLAIHLNGYQTAVYWRIHERIDDDDGHLAELESQLQGTGVPDIDRAVASMGVQPVRSAFDTLATESFFDEIDAALQGFRPFAEARYEQIRSDYRSLLEEATRLAASDDPARRVSRGLSSLERILSTMTTLPHRSGGRTETVRSKRARGHYYTGVRQSEDRRRVIAEWALLMPLADAIGPNAVLDWGVDTWVADGTHALTLRIALRHADWARTGVSASTVIHELLREGEVHDLLSVHTQGDEYYHWESLSELLWVLYATAVIRLTSTTPLGGQTARTRIEEAYQTVQAIEAANDDSHGRTRRLLARLTPENDRGRT